MRNLKRIESQGECDHWRGAQEVPDSNFVESPATQRVAASVIAGGGAGVGEIGEVRGQDECGAEESEDED